MPRRLKNIRPWKGKWQAYTEVAGTPRAKSFTLDTPVAEMREWIKNQRDTKPTKAIAGSFAADIAAYLPRVAALVTYKQRRDDLRLWASVLGGDRPRRTIKAAEIDQVMQVWLLAGAAPGTVRKRRMSLMSFWNKMDGKDQPNPVRGSQAPAARKPEARALDYGTIADILDNMTPGPQQLRARVIAWTGLPPKMLMQVTPADLNLQARTLRVRPRRKGKGIEARTLPLLPQAVEALKAFDAAKLYGPFNGVNLNHHFKRGCRRLDLEGLSVYDLRHSFLTMLYRVTGDLATVARFGLHANVAMAQRYAMGANQEVDRRAAERLGQALSQTPVP